MSLRQQFPRLKGQLVYLDSAASTQLPTAVIAALTRYYRHEHANIHRGQYAASLKSTADYEQARTVVRRFAKAPVDFDVWFTSGATAGLNQLAYGLAPRVAAGQSIIVTADQHHSNFLPWQRLARRRRARFVIAPIKKDGQVDRAAFTAALKERPAVVALCQVSNVTGAIHNVGRLAATAKRAGAITVVDAAQAAHSGLIDLSGGAIDFCVFSGHKVYGPTGVGATIGRQALANDLNPFMLGGGMVATVSERSATWQNSPTRHEAGTPPIAQVKGLVAALNWLTVHRTTIKRHQKELTVYAWQQLKTIKELKIVGPTDLSRRGGLIAFYAPHVHAHDIAEVAAQRGVALRAGHHCALPLHAALGVDATVRISFGAYNTRQDIDRAVAAIKEALTLLAR